jgi:hypothetical protein
MDAAEPVPDDITDCSRLIMICAVDGWSTWIVPSCSRFLMREAISSSLFSRTRPLRSFTLLTLNGITSLPPLAMMA